MSSSLALSVENFAVCFAGVVCIYYGILGVTRICTSDCSSVKVEQQGRQVNFSPIMAAFSCSIAIIAGFFLIRLRGLLTVVTQNITNFGGSAYKTVTEEGQERRQASIKFGLMLFMVFAVVVGFIKVSLLRPLDACPVLAVKQAPIMTSLRASLEKMEIWLVGSGFVALTLGLVLNFSEKAFVEGYAERIQRGESVENYGYRQAIHENLQYVRAGRPGGVTLKATGENLRDRPAAVRVAPGAPPPAAAPQADAPHSAATPAAAPHSAATPAAAPQAPAPQTDAQSTRSSSSSQASSNVAKFARQGSDFAGRQPSQSSSKEGSPAAAKPSVHTSARAKRAQGQHAQPSSKKVTPTPSATRPQATAAQAAASQAALTAAKHQATMKSLLQTLLATNQHPQSLFAPDDPLTKTAMLAKKAQAGSRRAIRKQPVQDLFDDQHSQLYFSVPPSKRSGKSSKTS